MDETRDRNVAHVDHSPDGEARIRRAIKVRKALGIFGRDGQDGRGFWRFAPVHAQAMFEYCYGIAWGQPLLDLKQRAAVVISALAAQQLDNELEWHVRNALNAGLTRGEIVEAIAQCSPHIGLSKTNQGLRAAKRAFEALAVRAGLET
jgi:4-carboxymuconolactone decarboxylase